METHTIKKHEKKNTSPDKAAENRVRMLLAGYGIYRVICGRSLPGAVADVLVMDAGSRIRVRKKRYRSALTASAAGIKRSAAASLPGIPGKPETKSSKQSIIRKKILRKILRAAAE